MSYRIKLSKIIVNKVFSSYEKAKRWALWNYRGLTNFEVIEIKERSHKPKCNCYQGNDMTQEVIWMCQLHGNLWNGIKNN